MSYNQGGQQGYGQYNPYAQQNPYDQRDGGNSQSQQGRNAPPQAQQYGQQNPYNQRPDLEHQSSSRYDEERGQGGYEMSNMNGRSNDPNRILNEVRAIDREVDALESSLARLEALQNRSLDEIDNTQDSALVRELNSFEANIIQTHRTLVARVKKIKQNPESGHSRNSAQVGKLDRKLKVVLNKHQQLERDYRQKSQDQIARQYRIVRPDASEQEIREAVEDTNQQVFSQQIMSSTRRGEATRAASKVKARHEAIQKIEQEMMILADLFNDLDVMVVQQEEALENIEVKAADVVDNTTKANQELTGAVDKARAARRKKWILLGIVVLIIIVIAVVLGVVFGRR